MESSCCPVSACAEVLGGKWTILLIRDLADGRSRFCELERSLEGISPRTLSLRLRALEEQGIVERRTFPEVPPRVEYSLTPLGWSLTGPLMALYEWSAENLDQPRPPTRPRLALVEHDGAVTA